jgi:phospholipase C
MPLPIGRGCAGEAAGEPDRESEPAPRHNNWYTRSGYSSGSYTKCADENEPGIAALHRYLATLPYPSFNNDDCEPGAYYLVNNYNAGFLPTGEPAPLGPQVFRIPPQTQPTIAEAYRERG